jgi:aerobic carbon-monoxide dehydrogenase medium subunit
VRIPSLFPGTGVAIDEVARRHGDFAMVGAAARVVLESGRIADVRVILTGVSDVAIRATEAEAALVGADPDDEAFRDAANQIAKSLSPPDDIHGSSAYRRHLARVLIEQTLRLAVADAQEAT